MKPPSMAGFQRDHCRSYAALSFLLLSLLHGAFADRNEYFNISSLCVGERHYPMYKRVDGAVLTSESENNVDCVLTFQTHSILQSFMLRFEKLALDCHDHLLIFDGAHALGNHKVNLSCQNMHSDVGTIFTQGNYVTLKYTTDSWSTQENGFKLIITAYKDISRLGLKCGDFECLNNFCIPSNLTCDGINHCGDNSDETSHALCIG
uniref:Putative low-density lipoprotein receptor domain class a n=1 Tax=Amblyomma triste TaxID=251400 RepID=A0A023GAS5_AMBTT